MPIREYRCSRCHTEFEELVFGDEPPPCSACGARDAQPLMSRCCARSGGDFSPSFGEGGAGGTGSGCSGCAGGNCGSCH